MRRSETQRAELGDRAYRCLSTENLYAYPAPKDELAQRLYGPIDLEEVIVANMVLFHRRAKARARA